MGSRKGIIYFGILFIFGITGMGLFRVYRQPLGPALELPTVTRTVPTLITLPLEEKAGTATATEIMPTGTATPQPLCGGPAVEHHVHHRCRFRCSA
jgi:hypothetical protein